MNQATVVDMLLAAHVRELASGIRSKELLAIEEERHRNLKRSEGYDKLDAESKQAAYAEFRNEWLRTHPLTGYVQNALRQLAEISSEIKRHTS
ncbi:hypothetical protein INR38_18880 [Delftia sp. SD018]|uniref:hypothetical protein n=1 Tax=unclassified Delftia TaxID=2613839 RepID=UPI001A964E97|nr:MULTISPECIES: hypothetical protein [unclassified Delftia]MBO0987566.1 hypothetical protein [Delftia sp. SD083]MBO1036143.1 hypothetical protein [Delftia sp. SD018]